MSPFNPQIVVATGSPKPIRIIHIEDDEDDSLIVKDVLVAQNIDFKHSHCYNKDGFLELLSVDVPDVVLCDYNVPGFGPLDAVKCLEDLNLKVAFILVTGMISEGEAVTLMQRSIDDYIMKDRLWRLPVAILNAIRTHSAEKIGDGYLKLVMGQAIKFRALIENTHEIVLLCDHNLRISYVSPSALRNHAFSLLRPHEVLTSFVDNRDKKALIEACSIFGVQNCNETVCFRLQTPGREITWVEATITNLIHDEHVKAIVCNFRDVTERKKNEELMAQTANRFRSLIENISEAIVFLDKDGVIKYDSPSVQRLVGYTSDEIHGRPFYDFVHPSELKRAKHNLDKLVATPATPVADVFRVRHKNGSWLWMEGTITNMLGIPSVNALVINYRDISSRITNENLLKKSEASLRSILENTNAAYLLLDSYQNVITFNEKAKIWCRKEMQVSLKQGIGLSGWIQAILKEDAEQKLSAVLCGRHLTFENKYTGDSGNSTWYRISMARVARENAIYGLLIVSENITAAKKQEEERDAMTAKIVKHNKVLEQFAFSMSHNLRAPVANIIGLCSLVQKNAISNKEDFSKCIDGLQFSAEKLDGVIKDLTTLLQSNKESMAQTEVVDLSALVQDILTGTVDEDRREPSDVKTSFKVREVTTVRSYLHSILFNLITNSIKYRRPDTRLQIRISSRKSGAKTVLSFEDNGQGIDLKRHKRELFGLYKKFNPGNDGVGLGLYLVKNQVELLGGNITVKSIPHKGTTFRIELPG